MFARKSELNAHEREGFPEMNVQIGEDIPTRILADRTHHIVRFGSVERGIGTFIAERMGERYTRDTDSTTKSMDGLLLEGRLCIHLRNCGVQLGIVAGRSGRARLRAVEFAGFVGRFTVRE